MDLPVNCLKSLLQMTALAKREANIDRCILFSPIIHTAPDFIQNVLCIYLSWLLTHTLAVTKIHMLNNRHKNGTQ